MTNWMSRITLRCDANEHQALNRCLSAWRFSHPKRKTKIDYRAGSDIVINEQFFIYAHQD